MSVRRTKWELIRILEKQGLSFIANVITTGCSKQITKLKTLVNLIEKGYNIRIPQFEMYKVLVEGEVISFSDLDKGFNHCERLVIQHLLLKE